MKQRVSAPSLSSGELLKTNSPLLTWLLFLVLGGGLLAVYYQRIAYLPNIEWRESLIYLAVVSFIGLAFGLLESLAIFLPGYIWAQELVDDSQLAGYFCFRQGEEHEPCVITIAKLLGIPFGFCLVVSHLALLVGTKTYVASSAVLILLSPLYIRWRFYEHPPRSSNQNERAEVNAPAASGTENRFTKFAFWFALSIALNLLALSLIFLLAGRPSGVDYLILSGFCVGTVLVSNHIVAARWTQNRRIAILTSLVATLFLVIMADRYASLTEKMMALYGVGNEHQYSFVVTNEGADLIEKLGLPNSSCGQEMRNKLCHVQMLSGIGADYYLKLGGTSFTIPKSMVIARSISDQEAK